MAEPRAAVPGRFFRFEATTVATSLLKGESKDYEIRDAEDRLVFACRTVGGSNTEPTVLKDAGGHDLAVLAPRRRVANMAYDLFPPGGGDVLASYFLQLRLRRSWRIELPPGRDRLAVLDAETAMRTILRDLLSGSPDVYLIVEGERQVARVERTRRPHKPIPMGSGLAGRLRRSIAFVLPVTDWTLLIEQELSEAETQALVAATLLLIDHTIAGHRSGA